MAFFRRGIYKPLCSFSSVCSKVFYSEAAIAPEIIAGTSIRKSTRDMPLLHYNPPPKQAWLLSFKTGDKLGIVDLDDDIFGLAARLDILHRVVVWQRAKRRAGTAKTKDRTEVRGGGRKPWQQKGSGRARQGSIRAPQFRGGGVVHGPRPKSYYYRLPQKVVNLGVRTALSVKYMQGDLMFVDCLEMDTLKTRDFLEIAGVHNLTSALLVDGGPVNVKLCKATRNLQKFNVLPSNGLNVYSMLEHEKVILSLGALRMLEERLLEYVMPVQMLKIED